MHSDNTRYVLSSIPYSIYREIRCCESCHQVQNEPPVSSVAGRNVATTALSTLFATAPKDLAFTLIGIPLRKFSLFPRFIVSYENKT